jgi:divalent metal cation (Fe/Co/Zn/Cd) transporter
LTSIGVTDREQLVRRGLWLNYASIAYNVVEAIVSIGAGVIAGSVALTGFGFDSAIEVTASIAARRRLRADVDETRRESSERITRRIVGWSFLALAVWVVYDSVKTLARHEVPDRSLVGLTILILSVLIKPVLARAKRKVARALTSRALESEARQTSLCAYLSFIALAGIAANAVLSWWWADPVAALIMVPIIAKEGLEGVGVMA